MSRRRAIRDAYYDGVVDATEHEAPDPGGIGDALEPTMRAKRQGWFDGRANRALRSYEFDAGEVLRRAEIRESEQHRV